MNKHEQYLKEHSKPLIVCVKTYTSPEQVELWDWVWDCHHLQWTRVADIEHNGNFWQFQWENGNGAGAGYMLANHRPRSNQVVWGEI
jgi:hypothetical protein